MTSYNQSPLTGLGPFQGMFHDQGLGNLAGMMPPAADQFMRGLARCQAEMQGLMTRRTQAYFELPGRLAQCRTPQDLMLEQQRFWQMAFEQYSLCSQHFMSAWSQAFQIPQVGGTAAGVPERDYLAFPDPRSANGTVPAQTRTSDRKVA